MEELNEIELTLLKMMAMIQQKKYDLPQLKKIDPEELINKKKTIEKVNKLNGYPIPEKQIIVCTRALEVAGAIKTYMVGKEKYYTVTKEGINKLLKLQKEN